MYYLKDICFLCLKNNIKLQSVLIEDTDGIVVHEKLRCFFPEIIDSIPDAHKLACSECLEKLRISYDFKQSVINNNTVFRGYIDKLEWQHKSFMHLLVVLTHLKQDTILHPIRDTAEKVENEDEKLNGDNLKLQNEDYNLTSTNQEQLNTHYQSCQLTTDENVAFFIKLNYQSEDINLKTENLEIVEHLIEIDEIQIKQEPLIDDNFTTTYLGEESKESEGNSWEIKDSLDIEMVEDKNSRTEEDSNEKLENTAHNLNNKHLFPSVVKHQNSELDAKFCAICQELLFTDLNNMNLHLNIHVQISDCSVCDKSVEVINKLKRHMWQHCEATVEIENITYNGEKLPCAVCKKEFKSLNRLKKHIYANYIKSLNCMFCSRTFSRKSIVMSHVLKVHCAVKLYQCKVCYKRFKTKENVENHMICMHYVGKVLVCKICKQKYRNPKSLQNHYVKIHGKGKIKDKVNINSEYKNQHDGSCQIGKKVTATGNLETFNPVIQPGTICMKQEVQFSDFTLDEQSKEHEEIFSWHINTGEEQCSSLYSYSNEFETAINASVTEQNVTDITESYCETGAPINLSNICFICQEMYRYLDNLLLHLNVHMQESSCVMCKESIENITKFQQRMLVPCGNNCKPQEKKITETCIKIPCAVCQKEFNLDSLKKHLRTHIPNSNCVLCSKSFISKYGKSNLIRHLLLHCDVKLFQCEICGNRFTVKESLKYHMTYIHSNASRPKKLVTCQYCNETLGAPSLRQHIIRRHSVKTITCEVCKKVYIDGKDFENHAKVHENRETT